MSENDQNLLINIRSFINNYDSLNNIIPDEDHKQIKLDVNRLGIARNPQEANRLELVMVATTKFSNMPYGQDYKPFIQITNLLYPYSLSGNITDAINQINTLVRLIITITNSKFNEETINIAYIMNYIDHQLLCNIKNKNNLALFLLQIRAQYAFVDMVEDNNTANKKILELYLNQPRAFLYFAAISAIETIKNVPNDCFDNTECWNIDLREQYNKNVSLYVDNIIEKSINYLNEFPMNENELLSLHKKIKNNNLGSIINIICDKNPWFVNINTWIILSILILIATIIIIIVVVYIYSKINNKDSIINNKDSIINNKDIIQQKWVLNNF